MSDPEIQPAGEGSTESMAPPRQGGSRHGCLWIIVILCIIGVAIYGLHRRYPQIFDGLLPAVQPTGAPPVRSVSVAVATALRGNLPLYLNAPGTVVALDTVTVRTRVDGQIMKVNYVEGGMVKAGDLLVQIDPRPFQSQLLQAQGQLARDEALLKNAQLDLARYQQAGRAATQQQLDTAKATVRQYEGVVRTDQGQIDNANLQLTYCRVTAPIEGRIGLRLVDVGNIVHANDTGGLVVIARIEPITVTFSLAQDNLPQILQAMAAGEKLPVEVLSRDMSSPLTTGTLAAVDSQIDPQTLTAKFKAVFSNKDHILFPNQAVSVSMRVEIRKNVVLIPSTAVQRGPQTPYAYVVKADETVEMRPIEVGPIEGDVASIDRGLSPGEVVVTAGVDNLAPGMKVTVAGVAAAPTPTPEASPKGMRR